MSAAIAPWAVVSSDWEGAWESRQIAISRGLRAYGIAVGDADPGFEMSDKWPAWAQHAYFAFPASWEVDAVRVLAEGSEDMRAAVEAAYALGGSQAVNDVLHPRVQAFRDARLDAQADAVWEDARAQG